MEVRAQSAIEAVVEKFVHKRMGGLNAETTKVPLYVRYLQQRESLSAQEAGYMRIEVVQLQVSLITYLKEDRSLTELLPVAYRKHDGAVTSLDRADPDLLLRGFLEYLFALHAWCDSMIARGWVQPLLTPARSAEG